VPGGDGNRFGSSLFIIGELESQILCLCAYEVNRDPLTQLERRRETEAAISARPAHIIQQRAENLLLYQNCKKWQRSKGKRLSLNAN